MSHWQERVARETPPAILTEHQLRYRTVAPLIATSAIWADLGCGNGTVAAAAVEGRLPPNVVLLDLSAEVVASAARELGTDGALQLTGDLTDDGILQRTGDSLLSIDGDRIVTCFEVVEHLATFLPFVEWSGSLARRGEATFVISVPNDAFWSIENPFHASSWSEGAFEELRRLLPREHTLLRQISLSGSAVATWSGAGESQQLQVSVGGDEVIASHFIAAYGPRHAQLDRGAVAVPVDQLGQRRWERQRESNLAFAEARLAAQNAEREDWRVYIHELEQELGRPLSGEQRDQQQG